MGVIMKLYQELFYGDFPGKTCHVCREKIQKVAVNDCVKNPITNKKSGALFHPNCYTPRILLPYSVHPYADPQIVKILTQWNSQFRPIDLNLFFSGKKLEFRKQCTRKWIEIFKFLTPEDIGKIAGVSQEFYELSWNFEVWKEISRSEEGDIGGIKRNYLVAKFNTCVACEEADITELYRNVLLKRCLCRNCHKNVHINKGDKRYSLRYIDDILKKYRISRSFIEAHQVPVLVDREFYHRTYPALIEKALESEKHLKSTPTIMMTRKKRKLIENSA